jgi:hypothetical protein
MISRVQLDDAALRAQLETIAAGQNGNQQAPAETPADELTALLGLNTIGARVTGATMYGRGSTADVRIHLTGDRRIDLNPIGKYTTASKLANELALQTGVDVPLTAAQVVRFSALINRLADHRDTMSEENRAADWGISYLQAAQVLALTMSDQRERWAAFKRLDATDPVSSARADGTSVAVGSVVLEDAQTRLRYVRASWFAAYVRQQSWPGAADEAARTMRRLGWGKPATEGRIKATDPGSTNTLQWAFWTVEAGWERR